MKAEVDRGPARPGVTTSLNRGPRRTRAGRREGRWAPYLFVLPLLAVFAGFYLWPSLQTLLSSFFQWGLLNPWSPTDPQGWRMVGVDNYTTVLTSASFWNAALNTAIWIIVFPALVTAFAMMLAILVWYLGRGSAVFRSLFVLPLTISLAATGVIWSFVYNPDRDVGVLNAVLGRLGILGFEVDWGWFQLHVGRWLSDPGLLAVGPVELRLTNVALVVPAFWAFTGFGVVTYTAGLTSLSAELVEAARVDGARTSQVVRYVVVPSLRQPMIVTFVVSAIFALRTFDIVYVMTGGGPAEDTMVLALLLWLQAFQFLDEPQAGEGAAMAVLMSAALIAAAYPYLRSSVRGGRVR